MPDAIFYWLGVSIVAAAALTCIAYAALWLYFNLLHGRFNAILFRPSQRRLSIASWHASKLMRKDDDRDDDWPADDWPISARPFYLSFRFGERRLFVLAGILESRRDTPIKGRHPTHAR